MRLFLVAMAVVLSACTVAVSEGTVVKKEMSVVYSKGGSILTDYIIVLEDAQGNDQSHSVSQAEYDSVEVGDSYKIEE